MPNTIIEINDHAFYYCFDLTSINIPESLEYIGQYAFCWCENLNIELALPDQMTDIEEYAFSGCSSITGLRIPSNLNTINKGVFKTCSSISSISIPSNIVSIGDYSFEGTGVKELIIPDSVTSVGYAAFQGSAVESIKISDSVVAIGEYCFNGCSNLSTVSLPKGITEISRGMFGNCTSLKTLEIPNGVTSIEHSAIYYSMEYIKIPDSVTFISGNNFSNEKTNILYYGTEKQWNKVDINSSYKKLFCIVSPVTGIEIEQPEYLVETGSSLDISPILYPDDATCDVLKWEIDNKEIAEFYYYPNDYSHVTVSGRSSGSTVLRCTTIDGDYVASCVIKVVDVAVKGISKGFDDDIELGVNRTKQLSASVSPSNASNQYIIWSTSDPDIVDVDNEGNIRGVNEGTATITAMTEEGGYTASCTVTTFIPVSEITLSSNNLTINKGASEIVYATLGPEGADTENEKLQWGMTTKNIVQLRYFYDHDPQGCLIIAKNGGQTRVTVSTEDGETIEYIDVTVVVPVTNISIANTNAYLQVNEKKQLRATISPSDATDKRVTWTSSNEAIATVNENGEVTALSLGETVITATSEDGGYSASCEVHVVVPVTEVKLDRSNISIYENETWLLRPTVLPEDASNKQVSWKSSDNEMATVDQDGVVTALKAGDAVITVTTNDGGYTANCEVSIKHKWNEEYTVDKEASCTEDGVESIHCSVCDAIDETTVRAIPKEEHAYGDWTVTKEPTCTEAGSKEKVCAECGDKVTEEIPAAGHFWDEGFTIDKEATCTEDGSRSIHCQVCGETKDDETIPASGHQFGDWEIIETSSCEGSGSEKHTCSVCGFVETRGVDPLGHTWEEEYTIDKAPTCTEEGSKSIHCTKCDAIKDSEVIPAIGHTYGEWEITKTPTCTEEGGKERSCEICNNKEIETILPSGHTWNDSYTIEKEATCTEEGHESIYCSICGAVDETTSRTIPKKNHAYSNWKVIKRATCTEEGILEKVCVDCGDVVTETIDAAGHTWGTEYTIDKEPTYTEEGSESIHCSVCGEIDQSTVRAIPTLPVGWKEDENGWRYQRTDGTYVKSQFEVIDGNTYYFNESEYRVTGLQTIDSKKYYFTDEGVMQTGWQTIDSKKYYFNDEGVMQTGWQTIGGEKYYFDKDGSMHIGWLQLGDKWYYLRTTGVMHTGMLKKDGIYYYLEKSGVRHSGWLQVNGKLYYFKTNGQMLTGWLQVKGKKYYFKTNGEMLKGWLQVKGKKFYFKTNGQMHTGWLKLNGKYYYFKETGQMVTGRYKIGNKWYTFNSNGVRQ